jgi:hypothetical protein
MERKKLIDDAHYRWPGVCKGVGLTCRILETRNLSLTVFPAVVDARFFSGPHSIEFELCASLPLCPGR